MKQSKTPLIIIIILIILAVFISVAYLFSNQTKNTSQVRKSPNQKTIELGLSDFQEEASGCGDFTVYKYSNKLGGLSVRVNNSVLQVTNKPIISEIQSTNDISIFYVEGENLFETMPTLFCNDYSNPKIAKPKVWTAISGTVTVSNLGNSEKSLGGFDEYFVRVVLDNINFLDESGINQITIHQLIFEKVLVGWYPG